MEAAAEQFSDILFTCEFCVLIQAISTWSVFEGAFLSMSVCIGTLKTG